MNICKGLTVYNKTQFVLVFIGIFSNIGIIFYTKNNSEKDFSLIYKLLMFIIIQNGVIIIKTFQILSTKKNILSEFFKVGTLKIIY